MKIFRLAFLTAVLAFAVAPHAAAQAAVAIGQWPDEGQRAAAMAHLDALMAAQETTQIGETIVGGIPEKGYSISEWFKVDPDQPVTIVLTCDGECSRLKLEVKGPDGYGDVKGASLGAQETSVSLPAGHPERLRASISAACSAPACAYAVGIYGTTVLTLPIASTPPAAKRDMLTVGLDAKAARDGLKRIGDIKVQDIKDLKTHDFNFMAYPGLPALIIGECEGSCGDVTLSATNKEGVPLGAPATGPVPRLEISAAAFEMKVHATASACSSDTCRFAVGVYRK